MLKVRRTRRQDFQNKKVTLRNINDSQIKRDNSLFESEIDIRLSRSLAKNQEIDDQIRSKISNVLQRISSYKNEIQQSKLQSSIQQKQQTATTVKREIENLNLNKNLHQSEYQQIEENKPKKVRFSNQNMYYTFRADEQENNQKIEQINIPNQHNKLQEQYILQEKTKKDQNIQRIKENQKVQRISVKDYMQNYEQQNLISQKIQQNDENMSKTTLSTNKHYKVVRQSQNQYKNNNKVNQEYYIRDIPFKETQQEEQQIIKRRYYSCQPQKTYSVKRQNYLEPIPQNKRQNQNKYQRYSLPARYHQSCSVPPKFRLERQSKYHNLQLLNFQENHLDKYSDTNKLDFYKVYDKITRKQTFCPPKNDLKMTASFTDKNNISYVHSNKASKLLDNIKRNLDNKKVQNYVDDAKRNIRLRNRLKMQQNLQKQKSQLICQLYKQIYFNIMSNYLKEKTKKILQELDEFLNKSNNEIQIQEGFYGDNQFEDFESQSKLKVYKENLNNLLKETNNLEQEFNQQQLEFNQQFELNSSNQQFHYIYKNNLFVQIQQYKIYYD